MSSGDGLSNLNRGEVVREQNGFRGVLAIGEFRALWSAEVISVCGDQLARVALSVLVFQRTSSAALTALTYALTFVPAMLGGVLLAGLADRFPRRAVLVISDVARAGLAGLMALPWLPLPVLWALVFGLALAGGPFKAAQLALLPDVLPGERLQVGLALRTLSTQLAQLGGFVLGGSALLAMSAQAALGLNAGTFILSALLVRFGVRARPAAMDTSADRAVSRPRSAVRILAAGGRPAVLLGLVWLAGLTVAPEGVAAPYAAGMGGSALAVGMLLAADPLGSAVGAWLAGHWHSPAARTKAMVPLAVVSGLALVPCALRPDLVTSFVLWAVCGGCSTVFLIQAQAVLIRSVPDARRAAVLGLASGGLQASQGLAVLAVGLLGEHAGVYWAVGGVGVATASVAALLGLLWRRARPGSTGRSGASSAAVTECRSRESDVTVAHASPSLPGSRRSNKVGEA